MCVCVRDNRNVATQKNIVDLENTVNSSAKAGEEKAFHTSVTLCDCESLRLTSFQQAFCPLNIVNMLFLVDTAG